MIPSRVRRPRHATIVAYLALFVALGGTSYAAINLPKGSVGTPQLKKGAVSAHKLKQGAVTARKLRRGAVLNRNIRRRAITGTAIRHNTLTGSQIDESTLATVPHADMARSLEGVTANQLRVRCPTGTQPAAGTCIELQPRPALNWGLANVACTSENRRLATYGELTAFLNFDRPIAPGGELTADLSESPTTPGQLNALVILSASGTDTEFINAKTATQRAFRCAVGPTN
ncbi:MAG: hypothetical protein GXY03_02510 [Solirubrobacterales bacterium]|nr:hypothetical protein [Solirubrobacterales bacterium]